jgi:hypothetical protein
MAFVSRETGRLAHPFRDIISLEAHPFRDSIRSGAHPLRDNTYSIRLGAHPFCEAIGRYLGVDLEAVVRLWYGENSM